MGVDIDGHFYAAAVAAHYAMRDANEGKNETVGEVNGRFLRKRRRRDGVIITGQQEDGQIAAHRFVFQRRRRHNLPGGANFQDVLRVSDKFVRQLRGQAACGRLNVGIDCERSFLNALHGYPHPFAKPIRYV
jgi:hypothetical protein